MAPPRFADLTGSRFARLTVLSFHDRQGKHLRWKCQCDCGQTHIAAGHHLREGRTRSCGCYNSEKSAERKRTHGQCPYENPTITYRSWSKMKGRCHDPRNNRYAAYGGRGIFVCEEWRNDFAAFFAHVGERPSVNHSIDRIDVNRGYEPGNVRWATKSEQAANKRPPGRFLDADDTPVTFATIAYHLAISPQALRHRFIRAGVL